MKNLFLFVILFAAFQTATAQSEIEAITNTLMDYIEGSTNGQPERLKDAFHPDLNLYTTDKEGNLKVWPGEKYIESTKEGEPTGEKGTIISIDYENKAAVAKVEISHPKSKNVYVDYFLLVKIKEKWTIIQKSYTRRASNKDL